jgi:large subunit ribosomal protein L4
VLDPAPYLETPSAKQAAALLAGWAPARGGVLVVLTDEEATAALSFRNLDRVSVLPATAVGIADLVGAAVVLTSRGALDQLTERAQ